MVLSNKKLKQKIRAEIAESFAASEAQNKHDFKETTEESLHDSATQKPRLSKREKRRVKIFPSQESTEAVNRIEDVDTKNETEDDGSEGLDEEKKKKKRKRDKDGVENVEEKERKDLKKKKSNKKKKKKKKQKGKGREGEDVEIAHRGSEERSLSETIETYASKEVDVSTKVYVGGIPYYSTVDDIRSYFEGCGTITEVDCLEFTETGKFNGIAMISFKTEAAAKRALELDGSDMGGLSLKIQPYKATRDKKGSDFAPAMVEGYNRIYIGNLSWDITEDELKKLFSDCSISSIRLGKDKETGEFRGYAHVDFSNNLSLSMALKLDGKIVCGRPVRIRCAVPPKVGKTNSKAMPTSKKADDLTADQTSSQAVNDGMANSVSGQIRRRTCYECGERGHLSSSCPKKPAVDPTKSDTKADDSKSVPTSKEADDNVVNSISGKMRRRTCYECCEKGHLSTLCPKKQAVDPTKSNTKADESKSVPTSKEADDNVGNSVSGKIKRRTCYECGERGHLSTSCPKKQDADLIDSSAT